MAKDRDKQIYMAYKVIKNQLKKAYPYTSHILAMTKTAKAFGVSFFDVQRIIKNQKGINGPANKSRP